ncbi:MAG: glycosyltransferase [Deltaproteobacteria bacterium]|jgi:glycosyltransferase involved in cell wall biosynthesis|nr:glycosyltransferase [Deltaproteobacteria bacterium]
MKIGQILLASFSYYPALSKQGRLLENIVKALTPRFKADILTVRKKELGYVEKYKKNRVLRVPVGGTYLEQVETYQRALDRQLDSDEYNIIHFRSSWEGYTIFKKKQYLDAKFIYEPAIFPPEDVDKSVIRKFLKCEKISLDLADMILVPSNEIKGKIQEIYPNKAVESIIPGVNIDIFDWDITTGLSPLDIIIMDNFNSPKQLDFLLQSFFIVNSTLKGLKIGLVGDIKKELAEDFLPKIKKHKLENNIKFFGKKTDDELALLLSRANTAVILPQFKEAIIRHSLFVPNCTSLFEHMACGIPVIAPDIPLIREFSNQSKLANLYDAKSVNSLAQELLINLQNISNARKKANLAYETVRSRYTSSSLRRTLIQAYAKLVPPVQTKSEEEDLELQYKSGVITYQGQETSSTGPGSTIPPSLSSEDTKEIKDSELIELDEKELEFEASGPLLGSPAQQENNPDNPDTSPATSPDTPLGNK